MNLREYLNEHLLYLDGGMGTLLQAEGLAPGEDPTEWNRTHPEVVRRLHRAYFDAGSNVVNTNTFGAPTLNLPEEELQQLVTLAVSHVRAAAAESTAPQPKWTALDMGPTGRLLRPYGDLDFEEAVERFARLVRCGVRAGADLIFIETMSDSYETKAALLAAKEQSDLPVLVSNAYGGDGKLLTGADPAAMTALLEGMGADAIGANCSLGPRQLLPVAAQLLERASVPVLMKPNAGLPESRNGQTLYNVTPQAFAAAMAEMARQGVRILGGCCGTTPDHIRAMVSATQGLVFSQAVDKGLTVVSSYTHAVTIGTDPVLIGERINPTGKKRLKEALRSGDMDYILAQALQQQEQGAQVLDVNVGLPELTEAQVLPRVMEEIQAVVNLPLQIDTADVDAMAAALRRYNGKALINSVSGKEESMQAIFPLAKRYGGVVVALTLDERGIPDTVEGRMAIARKIVDRAAQYGIAKKDLMFDPLAMTVSAQPDAATVTLETVERIRKELGCAVSLGVSNVSFGLPRREAVNAAFFAQALERGLSAAILNPGTPDMLRMYHAHRALHALDENCAGYIAFMDAQQQTAAPAPVEEETLQRAICRGLARQAGELAARALQSRDPMDLVAQEIVPALDQVGRGFEEKTVYLPQLLMAAEAAQAAFEEIRRCLPAAQEPRYGRVVLATVQGDIHDIGKNIVRLLLENYGFAVTDLGRDVPPETILQAVQELKAPLVGLSALMTTTVPAMERTIRLLRKEAPGVQVMVGGAVLTPDYARAMGADWYGSDAMAAVRCAQEAMERQQK